MALRGSWVLAGAVAFVSHNVAAQEFTSPEDLVTTLYGVYLSGSTVDRFDPYFSDRLSAALDNGRPDKKLLELLGLEALTGATQPGVLTAFNLRGAEHGTFTAQTIVSFNNQTAPVSVTFDLVLEPAHGWQIDHIKGVSGSTTWCSGDMASQAHGIAPAGEHP